MVLLAAAVIVGLAVAGRFGASFAVAPATPDPGLPALAATIDRDAARDIRAANSGEARAWLKEPKNAPVKGGKAEVVCYADI